MSYGVGGRDGSDLALLWLSCKPSAVAPIRPLALEPPYVMGMALKRQNNNNNNVGTFIKNTEIIYATSS